MTRHLDELDHTRHEAPGPYSGTGTTPLGDAVEAGITDALFGWDRCDHSGIGKPGCETCDPIDKHVRRRAQWLRDHATPPTKRDDGGASYGTAAMVCAGETEGGDRVWLDCAAVERASALTLAAENAALRANLTAVQTRCTELLKERRAVDWTNDVRALFRAFEQPIPTRCGWPDDATVRLRRKLIQEEHGETIDALAARDFPEFVDGCVDLMVVTLGALVACGVDPGPVWRAVQQANLTKAGGPVSSDGKRMKPPGFVPPDVATLLREQGWRA